MTIDNKEWLSQLLLQQNVAKTSHSDGGGEFKELLSQRLEAKQRQEDEAARIEKFKDDLAKYGAFAMLTNSGGAFENRMNDMQDKIANALGIDETSDEAQRTELNAVMSAMMSSYKSAMGASGESNTLSQTISGLNGQNQRAVNLASLLAEV